MRRILLATIVVFQPIIASAQSLDGNFLWSVCNGSLESETLIVGVDGIGVALGDVFDVSGIDADTTVGSNQAFTFLGLQTTANALSFGAGALWLENAGGPTMLFGNVDNDAVIEFAVRIDYGAAITAADYTVGDFIV